MQDLGTILKYKHYLLEDEKDCELVIKSAPEVIPMFGFDTETNTKIDMTKRDSDNINIMHDMPFLFYLFPLINFE